MKGLEFKFYDEEFIDGYFSGTIYIFDAETRVILDFGYDAEFRTLKLFDCKNPLYNSFGQNYEMDQISEFYSKYNAEIIAYIRDYLRVKYAHREVKGEF